MSSEILSFRNIGDKTVYNPTTPFNHSGKEYIGVRTESFIGDLDSEIRFAYKESDYWMIDDSLPAFQLQDPALTTIRGKTLLSGVYVEKIPDGSLRTDFYFGPDISRLEKIASGPWGMKDIRIIEMDDYIGVFTRPRGGEYRKGKIGFLKIKGLDELKDFSEKQWYETTMIDGLFDKNHWGGVSQAIKLPKDGRIGIIGHIAHQTTDDNGVPQQHYYAMSFIFNPETMKHSKMKMIAKRNDFPPSLSKRSPELDDVVFPGGIDVSGYLYCGLSDYCVGRKKIGNPFKV
ncbi:TPA: hypothetical protein DEX28_02885 [Patescibacteria group bacterium]|uniref:Uncharacterized protein n=1 Tax=Candidatus Woesebacteria bacterium GW2011_GWB1_44_11b TaxID=1618580 RepID=A0A0G1GHD0_9BACT|nr:MAG: hypothetical protein UW21_C0008G0013 [Candidatus Woesebacteria bacterium GW2011_GWB1_44_11b]HCI05667.1 hypothetical protein [Patescibacteria group bacterium]